MVRTPQYGSDAPLHSSIVGGREELRAGLLKPYLLRFRDERGESTVRALLSTAGLSSHIMDDEMAWISLGAARRALCASLTVCCGTAS